MKPSWREGLGPAGARPLAVLFALNLVDELDRVAFVTLAPDIREEFDLSNAGLGALNALGVVVLVTLAVPFAVLGDRGRRRTRIAGLAAIVWGGVTVLTGLARNVGQLALVRAAEGIPKATVDPLHGSLLADHYPPGVRGRVYGLHQAAGPAAAIIGPLLAGGVAAAAGFRWAFVVLAVPSVLAGVAALGLVEPARGAHEGAAGSDDADVPAVPLATGVRRLNQIRTLRFLYVGIGVLGFGLLAAPPLLSVHFEEHFGVGELGRGVPLFSVLALGTAVGLVVGGVAGDRLFRHDPSWAVSLVGVGLVFYAVLTAAALWLPALPLVVAVLVVSLVGVGAATASIRLVVAAVAPPSLRSLAFALLGVFIALYGGFAGGIIFGSIADATSPRLALTLLVVPGTIAGALIAYGARFVNDDIAMVEADVVEAVRAAERRTRPSRNLLEIRDLDFSYGPLQVLFGVDVDVAEGEVVALLGTNGAGKSTLLRAVTGLAHPTRGSIRFDGHDVTYLEAEQLLGLGIAQMPGGRAVFPSLTVRENLEVGAFSFRRDLARVRAEIDEVESLFPVLAARREQLAATLSGGEQQMLALGKSFLTRPRLLCIDELSLGLAPAVVGGLLDVVRRTNERGTTVVIVEQSLNVALALATTAVFMEKGAVRFVGPARELLDRPDLARSVFLEGAAR